MNNDTPSRVQILRRSDILLHDFGDHPPLFWVKLLAEGYQLDRLECAALGYLIATSKG